MREMNSEIGIEAFLFPYCKMQIIFFAQVYGYRPLYGCQIRLILLFVSTEAAAAQIRSFPRLLIFQTNNLTISFCGEWTKYVEELASAAFDPKLRRETAGHAFSLHIIGTGAGTKEGGGESRTSKKMDQEREMVPLSSGSFSNTSSSGGRGRRQGGYGSFSTPAGAAQHNRGQEHVVSVELRALGAETTCRAKLQSRTRKASLWLYRETPVTFCFKKGNFRRFALKRIKISSRVAVMPIFPRALTLRF